MYFKFLFDEEKKCFASSDFVFTQFEAYAVRSRYIDQGHLGQLTEVDPLTDFGWSTVLYRLTYLIVITIVEFCAEVFWHKFVLEKMLKNVVQHGWIHQAWSIHQDTNLGGSTAFPTLIMMMITIDRIDHHIMIISKLNHSWYHASKISSSQNFVGLLCPCLYPPLDFRIINQWH